MYAASVDGRPLTFEVSAVWRRNMIVRDRETGTLWQHATGQGLIGPLRGAQLTPLGGEQTTWSAWKAEHPETTIVRAPERWPGPIPKPLVERVLTLATGNDRLLKLAPGLHGLDRRLSPGEDVAGLAIAGVSKAYPIARLCGEDAINDVVGGVPIAFIYDEESDRVRAFDRRIDGKSVVLQLEGGQLVDKLDCWRWSTDGVPLGGTPAPLRRLSVSRQRWLGWSEFHPQSEVYGEMRKG